MNFVFGVSGFNHHGVPHMLSKNLNITTYVGETVVLPCELANLGSYHVNWLKIQDELPMALTVGYQQFSRNMRYRVARVHNDDNTVESWNFEIRKVAQEDAGLYECYVKLNSRHKIKANVYLDVKSEMEKSHKSESPSFYSSNCKCDFQILFIAYLLNLIIIFIFFSKIMPKILVQVK